MEEAAHPFHPDPCLLDCDIVEGPEEEWEPGVAAPLLLEPAIPVVTTIAASSATVRIPYTVRAYLVVGKILEQGCLGLGLMVQKDLEHLAPSIVVQFLGVTRVRDWLLLGGVEQADMSQCPRKSTSASPTDAKYLRRRHIADKDPFYFKDSLPLV
jgi:hypothetical protein